MRNIPKKGRRQCEKSRNCTDKKDTESINTIEEKHICTFWRSEEYAEDYTTREWTSVFRHQVYDKLVWDFTRKFLPEKGSLVLDAGGGSGFWSLRFAKYGFSVILLDFSKPMLEMAKKKLTKSNVREKISLILADIRHLPFLEKTFDFVFCEADSITQGVGKEGAMYALENIRYVLKAKRTMVGSVSGRYMTACLELTKLAALGDIRRVMGFMRDGNYIAKPSDPTSRMYLFTPEQLRNTLKRLDLSVLSIVSTLTLSQILPKNVYGNRRALRKVYELEKLIRKNKEMLPFSRRLHFAIKRT